MRAAHVARDRRDEQVGALLGVSLDQQLRAALPFARGAVPEAEQRGDAEAHRDGKQSGQPSAPGNDRFDFHRDSSR